ncbi:hypothetical protein V8C35DRAFT_290977 [Trichoderma chlorosporum]
MMPRCIYSYVQICRSSQLLVTDSCQPSFPLLSSHPGSLAVDLLAVSCSTGATAMAGRMYTQVHEKHGTSAPSHHDLTVLLQHHGIGRRNAKERDRRRQDGRQYSLIISCALINHIGGVVTHPQAAASLSCCDK